MSTSNIPGTNVPPISFPGIVSGIDYNAIIDKLTSLSLAPTVQLNAQIATLNAANSELIKINNLLSCVQTALEELSQPSLFNSFDAVSSNTAVATAQGIPSVAAVPGVYTIQSVQAATSSQVLSCTYAGHSMLDTQNGGPSWQTTVLNQSYAAITPQNGVSGLGTITIDGIQVQYNVAGQTLQQIFSNIQTAVSAYDPSFTIGFVSGTDTVQITGSKPITLGSPSDQGNLLQVLKLDQAQVNNSGPTYSVTGTSGVGGINQAAPLNSTTNAGFRTAVTAGTFTINGVTFTVNPATDNLASILAKINAGNAGVVAAYNGATNEITLTSTATGPQSIVLGSSSDTSNFLSAAGLTTASGATATIGQQAKIVLQTQSGGTQTIYSNSNTVTTAIPGVQINIAGSTNTPFTITVSQDSSQLVNALNTFVCAYNAAINEINQATAPPIVPSVPQNALPGQTTVQSFGGGILYGNANVELIKDELVSIVSAINTNTGSSSFNSLAQIGLQLDSSFTTFTTGNNGQNNGGLNINGSSGSSSNQGGIQQTIYQGTDGQLQPLNVQQLQAAFQANPAAVQQLLNGAFGLTQQMGSYLTGVTGFPTLLASGPVGTIPSVSLIQNYENANTDEISSLQQEVQTITDAVNLQANMLRDEFVDTETFISGYQALQAQLSSFFKNG